MLLVKVESKIGTAWDAPLPRARKYSGDRFTLNERRELDRPCRISTVIVDGTARSDSWDTPDGVNTLCIADLCD